MDFNWPLNSCMEMSKQIIVVKIVSFLAIVIWRNKLQNAAFQNTRSSLTFESFHAKFRSVKVLFGSRVKPVTHEQFFLDKCH